MNGVRLVEISCPYAPDARTLRFAMIPRPGTTTGGKCEFERCLPHSLTTAWRSDEPASKLFISGLVKHWLSSCMTKSEVLASVALSMS